MKQKFTLVLIISSFCCLKLNYAKAQVNVQDSLALVDLYNSTNGPGWSNHTNWLTSAPVASWYGVTVIDNRVTEIYSGFNNLSGSIPSSIGNLNNLTYLRLFFNNLNGSIPASLGKLINLIFLDLSSNHLSGSIPTTIGKLTNLGFLSIYDNNLTGSIPPSFGNLINLSICALEGNNLSGNLPASFSKLINLISLEIEDNQLTGNIQSIFSKLTKMIYLSIGENQFSGNISFLIKMDSLNYAELAGNRFIGKIPSTIDNLKRIGYIALFNNQLSGSIPSTLNNLSNLTYLNLSFNQLTGNIPVLDSLKNLGYFNVSNNQLSGTIPSLSNLHISGLDLKNNQFTFSGMENIATTFPFATYAPQANIHITQNGNLFSVDAGGTISNNTYKWNRNGKLYRTKVGNATLTASNDGAFTVEVTNSIATQLTLRSDTVNYAALNSTTTAAISNTIKPAYIFPNPATTTANVCFTASGKYTVSITDVSGKTLQTKTGVTFKQTYFQLNISDYQNGLYFIYISNEKNNLQLLRLNKQ